jgi:hypothetical protein
VMVMSIGWSISGRTHLWRGVFKLTMNIAHVSCPWTTTSARSWAGESRRVSKDDKRIGRITFSSLIPFRQLSDLHILGIHRIVLRSYTMVKTYPR